MNANELLGMMKGKRASLALLLLAIGAGLGLSACGGGSTTAAQPSVSITITPSVITVPQGGSQTFFATVQGSGNTAVTWTVQEGAASGTITSVGLYTAPSTPGVYHVIASSLADPTKSAVAIVTVPSVSLTISPQAVTVGLGSELTFSAQVNGTVNTAVTWNVLEGAVGGAVTSGGA